MFLNLIITYLLIETAAYRQQDVHEFCLFSLPPSLSTCNEKAPLTHALSFVDHCFFIYLHLSLNICIPYYILIEGKNQ